MYTVAIGNRKGGVGKTATAQNLGAILSAEHGQRVLMVDCDPQCSLTESMGIEPSEDRHVGLCLTRRGAVQLPTILVTTQDGLTLAPSHDDMAHIEAALYVETGREYRLRRALRAVSGQFDICIVDCPPSLSLLTVNALAAAESVIIPTSAQLADIRGVLRFLDTVDEISEGGEDAINSGLTVLGILPTFYDRRLIHHRTVLENMKKGGLPILPMTIGRSIRAAEAASAGESLLTYDPKNALLNDYRQLARIVNEQAQR